jgi:hypothetical protein
MPYSTCLDLTRFTSATFAASNQSSFQSIIASLGSKSAPEETGKELLQFEYFMGM